MKSKARRLKQLIEFRIIYVLSSILGLAPQAIKITEPKNHGNGLILAFSYSRVKSAYAILLIGLYVGIMVFGTPLAYHSDYSDNFQIIRIIDIALGIMGNTTTIVIIVLYSISQRDIIRMGRQLEDFDRNYRSKFIGRGVDTSGDSGTFLAVTFMLFIWSGVITVEYLESTGYFHILVFGPSGAFISWVLMQYTLVVYGLRNRFQDLNDDLLGKLAWQLAFANEVRGWRTSSSHRSIVEVLTIIRRARNIISRVSQQVSEFHSLPVLLGIFYCCCRSVTDVYHYLITWVHPVDEADGDDNAIDAIFWILLSLYPIGLLCTSIDKFQAETSRTADIIYDVMETYSLNSDINAELNSFSVELLHRQVSFDACGLFTLNCSLLKTVRTFLQIFEMIVAYLVILVQFKPLE